MTESRKPKNWQLRYKRPNRAGLSDEQIKTLGVAAVDYDPRVPRESIERRVLGHISDEQHVGRGPRNTIPRLALELAEDPATMGVGQVVDVGVQGEPPKWRWVSHEGDIDRIDAMVRTLVKVGLVERRGDGTLAVTEAGRVELAN